MKKIILGLLFIISIFFMYLLPVNSYEYNSGASAKTNIDGFLNGSNLVNGSDVSISGGFKKTILKWVKNISIFLSLMAVGSIVYGALLLTISTGEDEKIKKAKDTVKWGIIGFLAIISAGGLIAIIINFVYRVAG